MPQAHRNILPGFRLSLGVTVFYLTALVLLPLGALFAKAASLSVEQFIAAVWSPRAVAAYGLTFGAARWQTFRRVLFPPLVPALSTGFALAFARALGEYGSVIFVSGNMPFRTEIAPKLIVERLEQFQYAEATAIAVVLLAASFLMLVPINLLDRWSKRFDG